MKTPPGLILLIAAIAGVPLAIAPGLVLESDVTPKLVVLLCVTAGLLLCWNSWRPGAAALLCSKRGRIFAASLALWIAAAALSTIASGQPELSLGGSSWRRYGFVTQAALALFTFLCAAVTVTHREGTTKIILALAITGGVVSGYAIAQYAGLDPFFPSALYTIEYFGAMRRPPATLGNAVYLGSSLAAILPVTISAARKKPILWVFAALSGIGLVLTGSRAALLGLAAGLAVMGAGKPRPRQMAGLAAVCAVAAIAGTMFVNLEAGASFRRRLMQWRQDYHGGPRLLVWRESLALVRGHWATGYGPEVFPNELRRRQSSELSRAYPDHLHESPHNVALDNLLSLGVPGLLAWGGLLYLVVPGRSRSLKAAGVAAFASLLFLTITIAGALTFCVALALLVAEETPAPELVPRPAGPYLKYIAAVVAALFAAAGAGYLLKDMRYARFDEAVKSRRLEDARTIYKEAAAMWFPRPGDDLWCSRQFAALARVLTPDRGVEAWSLAAEAAGNAERFSDQRADALYQSALLAFSTNDATHGELKLRQSIEAAPSWYKPRLLMAQFLNVTGRVEESTAEANRAIDLAGSLRIDVARAVGKTPAVTEPR